MKFTVKKHISKMFIIFGLAVSSFGVTSAVHAAANTSDSTVHFTFRVWSPYDYTTARRKQNKSSMYMKVISSDKNSSFNVWTEADANVHSKGRDWKNVSGKKHEGEVKPGNTYLFVNTAVESYGKNVPVRFGGYSWENNAYKTNWSPDSVKPKGKYIEY
ncbi:MULTISPECIES: hypothetical protein [Bacillus]|uniref:DUF2712 domain-containing protein n=1 Tax=Bacillus subtilis TaxID=1423 RepID=A0AAP1H5N7_BACIU|nr:MULTISPECIES: hypothetical protein [Bacillus]WJD92232.1 hypothetical protein QR321_19365 [Bacillus spizizenii]CJS90433.1 Uncharacterised protein [Streptococcus pneumoniae]AGE65356.1 hypothetical protein C663_3648 [Bacillus subtilis XF-1]AGI30903.1 hypothetical protein I653_18345 [Bacillus subtilis subsp. subtilis str. BAB-1]AKD36964.1 hypothetical protein AW03_035950 [Bacillus subtilis HJ5]